MFSTPAQGERLLTSRRQPLLRKFHFPTDAPSPPGFPHSSPLIDRNGRPRNCCRFEEGSIELLQSRSAGPRSDGIVLLRVMKVHCGHHKTVGISSQPETLHQQSMRVTEIQSVNSPRSRIAAFRQVALWCGWSNLTLLLVFTISQGLHGLFVL